MQGPAMSKRVSREIPTDPPFNLADMALVFVDHRPQLILTEITKVAIVHNIQSHRAI